MGMFRDKRSQKTIENIRNADNGTITEEINMSVNKVMLLGRLGQDVEMKNLPNGTAIAKFSLATSRKFTDKNGAKQEKTQWHNIVAFSKLAEICNQYLSKGSNCFIEGEIEYQEYEKDGVKKYFTSINANNVQFLDSKSESGYTKKQEQETTQAEMSVTTDSIPF